MRDSLGNAPPPEMAPPEMAGFMPPEHEVWMLTPGTDFKLKDVIDVLTLLQIGLPKEVFDSKVPEHLKKHFTWKKYE